VWFFRVDLGGFVWFFFFVWFCWGLVLGVSVVFLFLVVCGRGSVLVGLGLCVFFFVVFWFVVGEVVCVFLVVVYGGMWGFRLKCFWFLFVWGGCGGGVVLSGFWSCYGGGCMLVCF